MKITVCAMRIISTLKPANYHVLISIVMIIPQKVRPKNFCVNFSGSSTPRNLPPPCHYGQLPAAGKKRTRKGEKNESARQSRPIAADLATLADR